MMARNSLLMVLLSMTLLTACGKEDKSAITSAGNAIAGTCPAGSTLQGNVCVGSNGSVTVPGGNPTTGSGTAARFYTENWHDRNLNIVGNGFGNFIQNAMGVCGPYTANPDCSPWVSGALDIVMLADNTQANQATVVFRLKPRGAGPMFPPRVMPLNFTLSVTNNYQGFEARAYGEYLTPSSRSLIQIQVATGKLQDNFFDYRIAYRGEIIMNGRFQKCSSADCGLNQNFGN